MNYVKGIINNIIYQNDSNGYTVGLIKVIETDLDIDSKTLSFVGNFHEIKLDQKYLLKGNIVMHNKYGSQFNIKEYELILPTKKEDIVQFLASGLFPIGEKTALKIYDKLGDKAITRILEEKDALQNIRGITEKRRIEILASLNKYQESNTLIMQIIHLGFSMKDTITIFNKYGSNSLEIINTNIYELIDIFDFSFKEIDKIALKSGYLTDDERRILALIINIMKSICFREGSIYVELGEIYNLYQKYLLNSSMSELEYYLLRLSQKSKIIINKDKYYLTSYYTDEEYIAYCLNSLNKIPPMNHKITKYIEKEEYQKKIKFDVLQKEAITKAINNNLVIITGGPGTGKTTIIASIVNYLKDHMKVNKEDIALLAPTGRASKKMAEAISLGSSTIHRFLKWDKELDVFNVNEFDPSMVHYVIVDEASMIDNNLMASLLRGLQKDIHLILVGDYYQLPSVKEGQVLKDLIDSERFNVIKLNSLYRQSEDSYINILAHEIKSKCISNNFTEKKGDYNFLNVPNMAVNKIIGEIVDTYLKRDIKKEELQVIVPMYKGDNGIDKLNQILQEKFNPRNYTKKELEVGEVIYRVGDKVLQLVNDPNNNVFNGDIGYVYDIVEASSSSSKKNEIHIKYDDNVIIYTPQKFIEIMHAYAISVHKSQGNEYDTVIIPVVNSFKIMMYNKLIYTAITRCKKHLILVGNPDTFLYAVNNDYQDLRKTTLKEKIWALDK